MLKRGLVFILLLKGTLFLLAGQIAGKVWLIDNSMGISIDSSSFDIPPKGGDTIYIHNTRTSALRFNQLSGDEKNPLVIINSGGQVQIDDDAWGAMVFVNCRYIKLSGRGDSTVQYGFKLKASQCGLAFTDLSSDCEAENIHINHNGFFGIYAKTDFGGNPPIPIPQFEHLSIHHCFIENVTEGMYLGETKTPGMEFRHVSVYNNVVRNTGRESIQIANMVEDVSIFNNTLVNAGIDNEYAQNNLLQIGDNSVAHVFNNILIKAPAYGIISFGSGKNYFENNYIALNSGVFIDNRTVTLFHDSIRVKYNFFRKIGKNELIKSLNEVNYQEINGNISDSLKTFYSNSNNNNQLYTVDGNLVKNIDSLVFQNEEGLNYLLTNETDSIYKKMGVQFDSTFVVKMQAPVQSLETQIVLRPEMITDEVVGGSYFPAYYLVDEQELNPESEMHPVSKSWKPWYNMNKAPYHIIFDLQHQYQINKIALHDMHDVQNLKVYAGEPGNWTLLFVEPCNQYKTWKIHEQNIQSRYLRLTMDEGVYAAVNELVLYGYPLETQIVLNSNMISDEVDGGSFNSPALLVDEQSLSPFANEHPLSESWKPYWNLEKAPYYAIIDLGKSYQLTNLFFHDMHNVADLEVEYGNEENWNYLLTEPCDGFGKWKKHRVNCTTRYLRLKMEKSIYAAVNELIVYGIPKIEPTNLKSSSLSSVNGVTENEEQQIKTIEIFPNPVKSKLIIRFHRNLVYNFNLEIFQMDGKIVQSNYYYSNEHADVSVPVESLKPGLYFLKFSGNNGVSRILKFRKDFN